MKAYLLTSTLALLSLVSACNKAPDFDDDFGGTGLLRGRLVYTDAFAGNGTVTPLAKRTVYLALSPSDQLNYKYSATTDKDGYFLFDHLNTERMYTTFFNDTIRQVRYTALETSMPKETPYLLQAKNDTLTQNGFVVTLRSNSTLGISSTVANANICVFANRLMARADTCLGSLFTLKTDNYGRVVRYNLRPATYYIFSSTTLNGRQYHALDSVTVPVTGIIRKPLTLSPYSRQRNGFDLTIIDRRGTPLAAAQVCMFNSAILARVDTCAGSIRQLQTDINGHVVNYNLASRRYYFRLYGTYGRLRLKGYDSLDVPLSGIALRTVTLR